MCQGYNTFGEGNLSFLFVSRFLSDLIVFAQQLSVCSNIYCQSTHLSITALKTSSVSLFPRLQHTLNLVAADRSGNFLMFSPSFYALVPYFALSCNLFIFFLFLSLSCLLPCYLQPFHVLVSPTKYVTGN